MFNCLGIAYNLRTKTEILLFESYAIENKSALCYAKRAPFSRISAARLNVRPVSLKFINFCSELSARSSLPEDGIFALQGSFTSYNLTTLSWF